MVNCSRFNNSNSQVVEVLRKRNGEWNKVKMVHTQLHPMILAVVIIIVCIIIIIIICIKTLVIVIGIEEQGIVQEEKMEAIFLPEDEATRYFLENLINATTIKIIYYDIS